MNKIKLFLMALGLIFAAVLAYYIVSFVVGLIFYALVLGVVALTGVAAYKMLSRPKRPELQTSQPERELADAQKLLDDYRRKINAGRE